MYFADMTLIKQGTETYVRQQTNVRHIINVSTAVAAAAALHAILPQQRHQYLLEKLNSFKNGPGKFENLEDNIYPTQSQFESLL